jgi:aryl-alcohol dehydrogenase-like predicted oxidoreductase
VCGCTFNNARGETPSTDACVEIVLEAFRWGLGLDTAPLYRDSEEIIGKALAQSIANGADPELLARHVITKVGLRADGICNGTVHHGGATAEAAKQSLEESIKRMNLVGPPGAFAFHDIAGGDLPTTNDLVDAAVAPGGMIEGLRELREQGAIREVSLGMNANGDRPGSAARPESRPESCTTNTEPQQILKLLRAAPPQTFDSALISGGWNLLNQDAYEVFVECEQQGISVHNAGVFAGGLIAGGTPTERMPYVVNETIREKVKQWEELADEFEVPLVAVALRFAALPAVVSKLVIGFVSPDEVRTTLTFLRDGKYIPSALFETAKARGLIRKEIDLPEFMAFEDDEVLLAATAAKGH